jgi:hypothetical protein
VKTNYSWNIDDEDFEKLTEIVEDDSLYQLVHSRYPKHMIDIRIVYNAKEYTQRLQIHLYGTDVPKRELDELLT